MKQIRVWYEIICLVPQNRELSLQSQQKWLRRGIENNFLKYSNWKLG